MRYHIVLAIAIWASTIPSRNALADDSNFLVLPVTTDLQRSEMEMDLNVAAYVLVNGAGLIDDKGGIRWEALDFTALGKALKPLRQGKSPGVIFHIYHTSSKDDAKAQEVIRWALLGFGQEEASFHRSRAVTTHGLFSTSRKWDKYLEEINETITPQLNDEEPSIGNASFKVSPVRTVLSRHLFSGADCVVTLTMPFEKEADGSLSAELLKEIQRRIDELKLTTKSRLLFRVQYKRDGREATTRFEREAEDYAQTFGFKSRVVQSRYSP